MVPASLLTVSLRTAAVFPGGPTFDFWCRAVSSSVVEWLSRSGVLLAGASTGMAGTGTVSGAVQFNLPVLPAMEVAARAAGWTGPASSGLVQTLYQGLSTTFNGAPYAGTSAGVGSGLDLSYVVRADGAMLAALFALHHRSLCSQYGGTGDSTGVLYRGTAAAAATFFLSGRGNGIVTGSPATASAVGSTRSRLV